MSLRLYLDECISSRVLQELLVAVGHDVVGPTDVNPSLAGASDEEQLLFASHAKRAILTANPQDFKRLHNRGISHWGIIGVYQDGNAEKDMKWREIVHALANLEATGLELKDAFVALNKYRW